jgi:hypothetical protein
MLGQLESQGFVKRGRRGKRRSGDKVFTLVDNEEKLQKDYFCPTLNIAHHVSVLPSPYPSGSGPSPELLIYCQFVIEENSLPGNTVVPRSLSEYNQPDRSNATPKFVSKPSVSYHNYGLQPSLCAGRASLGEDSSTEGTVSPHSDICHTPTPGLQTPFRETESRQVTLRKKRVVDTEGEDDSGKRLKVSSARSPWLFDRK